ncbi:MAG: hypothetical protein D6820_00115 [Lentisphaerae bacterium]|nr:MAG: hypothetical protein D6820_00115 [Lentisphaerota bacterium]
MRYQNFSFVIGLWVAFTAYQQSFGEPPVKKEEKEKANLALVSQPVLPVQQDQSPIIVKADRVSYNVKERKALFEGNAHVVNGQLEIFATSIEVNRSPSGEITQIIARGGKEPVECHSPEGKVFGEYAFYDAKAKQLVISGKPRIIYQDGTILKGMEKIIYNEDKGQLKAVGGRSQLISPHGIGTIRQQGKEKSTAEKSKKSSPATKE